MKKRIVLFALVCAFVFLLLGCTSAKSVSMALKTGFPVWYYNPDSRLKKTQVGFSGIGTGQTERQAELLAYNNILENVSDYLGGGISKEYSREFLTLGTIDKFGLVVSDTFYSQAQGSFTAVLRAVAPVEKLKDFRSEKVIANEALVREIEDLIEMGDQFIMESRDLNGVSYFIKSLAYSYNASNVPEEYSFSVIMNEVLDILKTTRMVISEADPENLSCTLKVKRKESAFYENIVDCPVKAVFQATNNNGVMYEDYLTFSSDRNGKVYFKTLNNSIPKNGTISFIFNLEDSIESLERVSPENAEIIRKAVNDKKVEFVYSTSSVVQSCGVCVYEYYSGAEFSGSSEYSKYLAGILDDNELTAFAYSVNEELSETEFREIFFNENAYTDFALRVQINPIDVVYSANSVCLVNVEGSAILYKSDGSVVLNTGIMFSSGIGTDYKDARDNAFKQFCTIVSTKVKAAYV